MEDNHKLGLYVSYYLARYNLSAYNTLNFGNQSETHSQIGEILSVNPNTVKNWRDEFDPLFDHRAGWYQRPLSASRVMVANALSDLSEEEVWVIVRKILFSNDEQDSDLSLLTRTIEEDAEKREKVFILRAPTGRKAEEYFIDYFNEFSKPYPGKLIDTRDLGCGYDFKIEGREDNYYVEVKGLSKHDGGILFTNKEWVVAKELGGKYFIALVSNIDESPIISFINNPFQSLSPKESIQTTIQVNWSVSAKQLKSVL